MFKIFGDINKIFSEKHKLQLIFIFFFAIIISIIETIGIGSLVAYVMILQDPYEHISKIPLENLKIYLKDLDKLTIAIYSSLFVVLFFIFKNLTLALFYYCEGKITKNIRIGISKNAFSIILNKSYKFHVNQNRASFINLVVSVSSTAIMYIFGLLLILREALILIFLFTFLIFVSAKLSLIVFLILILSSYIFYSYFKKKIKLMGSKKIEMEKKLYKYLNEAFASIKLIKLLEKNTFWIRKYFSAKNRLEQYQLINYLIGRSPKIFLELLAVISVVGVFLFFISSGKTIEDLIPILTLIVLIIVRSIPGFVNINTSINALNYSYPALQKILNVFLENKNKIIDGVTENLPKKIINLNSIELKNVHYSHEERDLTLNNISIKINKGDVIGITGKTGSGKTTLVDIILGLLVPQKGEVLINGKIIEKNSKINVGYVTQDTYLTDDSILENIAFSNYVDDIDIKKVDKAVNRANLKNFIESLPNKINTLVGDAGARVSGGQKQRIGLARAIYEDPDLLVLDEATSSLDYETEEEIINNIFKFNENKIILMITHRLSTLKFCNKVINLEKGGSIKSNNET